MSHKRLIPPHGKWRYKIDGFQEILKRDDDWQTIKTDLIEFIKLEPLFKRLDEDILDRMGLADDTDEFDEVLDEIYDYADYYEIWLEL